MTELKHRDNIYDCIQILDQPYERKYDEHCDQSDGANRNYYLQLHYPNFIQIPCGIRMVHNSLENGKEVQIMAVNWQCYLKTLNVPKMWCTKTSTLYLYNIIFITEPVLIQKSGDSLNGYCYRTSPDSTIKLSNVYYHEHNFFRQRIINSQSL